jgi:ATP-dependent DNA helicase DinG
VQAGKRLTQAVIQSLREEIREAGGSEVYAFGWLDDRGLVARSEVQSRGNAGAVPALPGRQETPPSGADGAAADVLIHNHPSGFLVPSDNDLSIAARAAEAGIGSFIVDNAVERVYAVVEPVRRQETRPLDADELAASLEEGGAVANRLEAFESRPSQIDLMRLIIRGFNEDALVAAEAGTGVGKSLAYLLPAMRYALDNGERIVISTATINLQEQLYHKDIPLVTGALGARGKKIKTALVKGRGNYLCRRRLAAALRETEEGVLPGMVESEEHDVLVLIHGWAETTATGSRSDLSFFPPEAVWSRVSSESDLCMGMRCPERERCFFLALRKACSDARILVVNHHLLFADLAARSGGAGYDGTVVLPPFRRVVIDEAHTVEDAASSFFSESFSRPLLLRLLARLYRRQRARQTGLLLRLALLLPGDSASRAVETGASITGARTLVEELDAEALTLLWDEGTIRLTPAREGLFAGLVSRLAVLSRRLSQLAGVVRDLLEALPPDGPEEDAVWEIRATVRRLEAAVSVMRAFLEYRERTGEVIWLERHAGSAGARDDWAAFHVTPIHVAPPLRDALFMPNRTVIAVSATLTVNGRFDYWENRAGIALVKERQILTGVFPSPFPYAASVLLAVPSGAPLPEDAAFRPFVDEAVSALAACSGGSALVLFTSYDALQSAWNAARGPLEEQGIRCLRQGDDDRSRLLKAFLADESSVLFATHSFWEGVDAPGNTLRLVILCRLPFKSPADPVFAARGEDLEKQGGSAFMDLSLPEAVIKFKQGFGRLMRRSSDHGVVAVLDGRLLRKRYGELFLRSIPETRTSFGAFDSVLRDTESFLWNRR